MTRYQLNKGRARDLAIQWQQWQENAVYDYASSIRWASIFEAIGRKYGLLREFRENGIL